MSVRTCSRPIVTPSAQEIAQHPTLAAWELELFQATSAIDPPEVTAAPWDQGPLRRM
jgi:hypothetical protein